MPYRSNWRGNNGAIWPLGGSSDGSSCCQSGVSPLVLVNSLMQLPRGGRQGRCRRQPRQGDSPQCALVNGAAHRWFRHSSCTSCVCVCVCVCVYLVVIYSIWILPRAVLSPSLHNISPSTPSSSALLVASFIAAHSHVGLFLLPTSQEHNNYRARET